MTLRLIDAGPVSGPRSQALYHGLAHAFTDDTPDTVVLCTPRDPYVSIGLHEDLRDVDRGYCADHGLPIIRREVGGGAVLLDRDQLFVQWIMRPESLPLRVEARYERFTTPLIATYRALGVDAVLRPVNDVHVGERKIAGLGAGRIGAAEVLVGNVLFDFDVETMCRVLALDEAFRAEVREAMQQYMTTLRRELDRVPSRDDVIAAYRDHVGPHALSSPTHSEQRVIEAAERRFASEEWLVGDGGLRRPGVKIHADVWVVELTCGTIRLIARTKRDRIESVRVVEGPPELEQRLSGVHLDDWRTEVRRATHVG